MTQTYHQANGQPTEGGGCLKFGITSVLFLSAISVIFMLVVSVKPTSPPSASAAAGATIGGGAVLSPQPAIDSSDQPSSAKKRKRFIPG